MVHKQTRKPCSHCQRQHVHFLQASLQFLVQALPLCTQAGSPGQIKADLQCWCLVTVVVFQFPFFSEAALASETVNACFNNNKLSYWNVDLGSADDLNVPAAAMLQLLSFSSALGSSRSLVLHSLRCSSLPVAHACCSQWLRPGSIVHVAPGPHRRWW